MPVSILLVQVPLGCESSARDIINGMESAEVTETGNGFLVAATDSEDTKKDYALIEAIEKIENVINVSLIMTANEEAL